MVDKKKDRQSWIRFKDSHSFLYKIMTAKVDRPIDILNFSSSSIMIIKILWMQAQLIYILNKNTNLTALVNFS